MEEPSIQTGVNGTRQAVAALSVATAGEIYRVVAVGVGDKAAQVMRLRPGDQAQLTGDLKVRTRLDQRDALTPVLDIIVQSLSVQPRAAGRYARGALTGSGRASARA